MTRVMSNFLMPWLLLVALTAPCAAREWPDNPDAAVSSFGTAPQGKFTQGIRFFGEGQRVYAWSEGEAIWTTQSFSTSSAPMNRDTLVLEHENGFRSAYRGIEYRPDLAVMVASGEWLGYTSGSHWSFEIRDTKQAKIVNPLSLLPSRKDLPSPIPELVVLQSGDNQVRAVDGLELHSGFWDVIVHNLLNKTGRAFPIEISLYWVGARVGTFRFDALAESNTGLMLETPVPQRFDSVFNPAGQIRFPDVQLSSGKGILELRVKDESGRTTTRSWNLNVRP